MEDSILELYQILKIVKLVGERCLLTVLLFVAPHRRSGMQDISEESLAAYSV